MKMSVSGCNAEMSSKDQPDHMNERIFQRNRLPPRAYYLPKQTLSLSGKWKFHYADNPVEPQPSSCDVDAWSPIDVPGHWQLQGWGHPHYTNINFPFPCNPPFVPSQNPTGYYETTFQLPKDWTEVNGGLEYRLRFEGVDSAFHLWVNEVEIGYSQGSRNAAEFDISQNINGEAGSTNTLRLKVYQWSDGSYIEDQDQWWLSGIFRDVYLIAFPRLGHIEDYFVQTNLRENFRSAYLNVKVNYALHSSAKLTIRLRDPKGHIVGRDMSYELTASTATHDYGMKVERPLLWNAEHPHLYHLYITLSNKEQLLQEIVQEVGFRDVRVLDGLLKVNGTPISIRGVNRHDHRMFSHLSILSAVFFPCSPQFSCSDVCTNMVLQQFPLIDVW